jgi:putative serine protease PepD
MTDDRPHDDPHPTDPVGVEPPAAVRQGPDFESPPRPTAPTPSPPAASPWSPSGAASAPAAVAPAGSGGPDRGAAVLGLGGSGGPASGPAGSVRPRGGWSGATGGTAGPAEAAPPHAGRNGRSVLAAAVIAAVLAGGVAGAGVTALAGDDPGTAALPRAPAAAAAARPAGSLAQVAQRVLPSVVSVQVRSASSGGTGSGFVLDADGHLLTNAHVVGGAQRISVIDSTGRLRAAEVVGVDASTDLAVLRVAGGGLPPVTLGRSADLAVGDPVLAVGSPLGLSGTVTAGIVSATDREVRFGDGRRSTAVQTDASINPGNSGGPLVDGAGRVVGVNTQIATLGRGSGNIGIGFAIPVDRAADVAERLIAGS